MQSDDIERPVMFKQLQDLQQRQQLHDLGDTRNQNFVNQLASLKHASVGQFWPTVNGGTTLVDSSQMSIFGNMETMPRGLVLTQNHNPDAVNPVGLLSPQFDMSSYGTHATNGGKNFNQYSHPQGPSNLSVDMRTKNHNNLGVASMQPSSFGSSFMNQQLNFPSDQICIRDGQGPVESFDGESLSGNYSMQRIPMQENAPHLESEGGHQDAEWDGFSPGLSSNLGTASLDPLEKSILYGTDDNIWESSLRSSKISTGGFQTTVEHASHMDSLPSLQSGSWSALMLSAVEETSSSDTTIQEERSGFSVKNPGSLNGIQSPNFIQGKKLQSNWVNRNLQNVPPPSSGGPKHLFQNFNINHSFPNFSESGPQYGSSHATLDHFPGNSVQLIDYSSQQKIPARGTQPIHAPLPSTALPDSGFRFQAKHPQAPQAYSFFPTLGSSSATFLSGNSTNDTGNQHPVLSVTSPIGIHFPASSAGATHHAGIPIPSTDIATQQDTCSRKPQKFSNLFGFPNSPSSSLEATEHPNQKSFQHEHESGRNTRRLEGYQKQLKQGNSLPESSSEINNSVSLGSTNTQEYENDHHIEAHAIGSDSLMDQQHCNQVEWDGNEVPPGDIGASGDSLSQNYSLVHHIHSLRNVEAHDGMSSLSKYNNVNHEKSNANAVDLFTSGLKPVKDIAKSDPHVVPRLIATSYRIVKGLNFPWKTQINEMGRASLSASLQKQADMFGQNDTPVHFIGGIEAASNLAYPSQISLQNAPSWIKHHGTLKDGNTPTCEPTSKISAEQQFSELQQNSLTVQVNLAQGNHRSAHYPSTAATSILSKQLDSLSMVASDVTSQQLVVSVPKKRKLTEYAMVPWHKEMNHEPSGHHDISIAGLVWTQALNRRAMQVKDEADVVEEFPPPVRAKRRLICNTQLMQQVFAPMPVVILQSDASSSCNLVPDLTARLTLGDACNLTSRLSGDANDTSPDKPKNSNRRNAREFSKVVEGFINQVQKLHGVLFSVSKKLSYAALKLEAQELEKFSIINRFAKIHIKAVDPAASSPAMPKANIQRYVVAIPMSSTLPEEGVDCLSL